MKKSKSFLLILLVISMILQNINCIFSNGNINVFECINDDSNKGYKTEENVIVDEIEQDYERFSPIIIGELQDTMHNGIVETSINEKFKYIEGEVIVYKIENNKLLFGNSEEKNKKDELDELIENGDTLYRFDTNKNKKILFGKNDIENIENDKSVVLVRSDKFSTKELIENLSKKTSVYMVEPNYVIDIPNELICNDDILISGFSDTEYCDDDFTNLQFDKSNLNDEFHKYSIKEANWNVLPKEDSKNSEGTVVAVIDTGVDYEHPDLKNVMWNEGLNYPSLTALGGGANGINVCAVGSGDSKNIMDDHSHGTHCSGIIAAEWNNFGVSGVCNGAKIMGVKCATSDGRFAMSNIISGYNYVIAAKKAGVNIVAISCSWGGSIYSFILKELILETEKCGMVNVFSSGNESSDLESNDSQCKCLKYVPSAIVVNSSTIKGGMSSFSNYGKSYTNVFAPGTNILSTIPRQFSSFPTDIVLDKYLKRFVNDGSSIDLFDVNNIATNSTILDISASNNGLTVLASGGKSRIKFNKLNISSDDFNKENAKLSFRVMGMDILNPLGEMKATLYLPCVNVVDANDKRDIALANVSSKLLSTGSNRSIYLPIYKNHIFEVDGKEYKIDTSLLENFYCVIELESLEISSNFLMYMLSEIGVVDCLLVPYLYMSGTSMACPQVSGIIAVIAANYPNETPAKWVARVKGSVYDGASLKELIESDSKLITKDVAVSGGLVSLEKSLQDDMSSFSPVLNNIKFENNKYVLTGFFFGNSGEIKINGVDKTANVDTWSNEKIVIDINNDANISGTNILFEIKNNYLKEGHQYFDIEINKNIYNTKNISEIPNDDQIFGSGKCIDVILGGDKTYFVMEINNSLIGNIYMLNSYDNKKDVYATEHLFAAVEYNISEIKKFIYIKDKIYFITVKNNEESLSNNYIVYDVNNKTMEAFDVDDSILGDNVLSNSALYYDEKKNNIYLFGGELTSRDGNNKVATKKIYTLDLTENKIMTFDGELSTEILEPYVSKPVKNIQGKIYFYVVGRESGLIDKVEFLTNGQIKLTNDAVKIKDYVELISDKTSYVKYVPIEHGFYVAGIERERNGRKYNNYKLNIETKKLIYDGCIRDSTCKYICGWTYNKTGNILSYTENGVTSLMLSYFPYSRIIASDEIKNKKIVSNGGGGGGSSERINTIDNMIAKQNIGVPKVGIPNSWIYDPIVNKWYRIGENGISVAGWFKDSDNKWYYLNNEYMMTEGYNLIDNKWYYFTCVDNEKAGKYRGEMYINEFVPDGRFAGSDGAIVS